MIKEKLDKAFVEAFGSLSEFYNSIEAFSEDQSSENLDDIKTFSENLDRKIAHLKQLSQFFLSESVGIEEEDVPAEPSENGYKL